MSFVHQEKVASKQYLRMATVSSAEGITDADKKIPIIIDSLPRFPSTLARRLRCLMSALRNKMNAFGGRGTYEGSYGFLLRRACARRFGEGPACSILCFFRNKKEVDGYVLNNSS